MRFAVLGRAHRTEAGQAALDYYDHAVANWRRSMRLPLLICLALGLGAIAASLWLLPHGTFLAGAFLGATEATLLWMWSDPPHWVRKWKRGGEGERRTGRVLAHLEPNGWRSYHGRAARYGDLDHVVIGPGGVFLLESKNLDGTLSVDSRGLTATYGDAERDSFTLFALGKALTREAVNLKSRIEAETGLRRWVQAVVVVWGDFGQGASEVDNVVYLAGDELESWLRSRPARLSPRDLSLLQHGMDSELIVPRAAPLVPST